MTEEPRGKRFQWASRRGNHGGLTETVPRAKGANERTSIVQRTKERPNQPREEFLNRN